MLDEVIEKLDRAKKRKVFLKSLEKHELMKLKDKQLYKEFLEYR